MYVLNKILIELLENLKISPTYLGFTLTSKRQI